MKRTRTGILLLSALAGAVVLVTAAILGLESDRMRTQHDRSSSLAGNLPIVAGTTMRPSAGAGPAKAAYDSTSPAAEPVYNPDSTSADVEIASDLRFSGDDPNLGATFLVGFGLLLLGLTAALRRRLLQRSELRVGRATTNQRARVARIPRPQAIRRSDKLGGSRPTELGAQTSVSTEAR